MENGGYLDLKLLNTHVLTKHNNAKKNLKGLIKMDRAFKQNQNSLLRCQMTKNMTVDIIFYLFRLQTIHLQLIS